MPRYLRTAQGVGGRRLQTSLQSVGGGSSYDDPFDGTGALDPKWLNYQAAAVPGVQRNAGFYRADITDNTSDVTLWFHGSTGRFDYQGVTFPLAGVDEYVFNDVGIGPTSNPSANHVFASDAFNFCGIMIHNDSFSLPNYMFQVVGHRSFLAQSTLELKSTVDGGSSMYDVGTDAIGAGVTHCDMRVRLHSDGAVDFAYRAVGGGGWTLPGGDGLTPTPRPALGAAGDTVYLGLITYAQDTAGLPFAGTVDSVSTLAGGTAVPLSGAAVSLATAAGVITTSMPITGSAASITNANGALSATININGAAVAEAIAAAALSSGIALAGDAVAAAIATGGLSINLGLNGSAVSEAAASGVLSSSGAVSLSGNAAASADASAALTMEIPISGASMSTSGASGSLGAIFPLSGGGASVTTAVGALNIGFNLAGNANASSLADGTITFRVNLSAAAVSQASAAGALNLGGDHKKASSSRLSTVRHESRHVVVK